MIRKHIPLIYILSFSFLALVGCGQTPTANVSTSSKGITPPSNQYATTVKKSVGNDAISNFQFDYIKQLSPTLSVCLYTFKEAKKSLFNESLVALQKGQWDIAYSAIASPVYYYAPFTKMDMNGSYGGKITGNIQVGSTWYQIIGGFINDPAISKVELTDWSGEEIRPLHIEDIGKLKMYAYAQVMRSHHFQGWQIQTYDKFGSLISLSNAQLKALGIVGNLPSYGIGKSTTVKLQLHPRPFK